MPRQQASLNLDPEIFNELDREAARNGESRSEAANRLLRRGIRYQQQTRTAEALVEAGIGTACLVAIFHLGNILTLLHL